VRHGRADLRAAGVVAILMVLPLMLASCSGTFSRTQLREESCVRNRLNAAAISYEDAKGLFAEHFRVRSDISLRYAYMASLDSSLLARSIRGCFDFDRAHIPEAKGILRSNRMLRGLVKSSMRDADAQQAIGIFGDDYREIFKNDIH
jgi:hypothetical protein